MYGYADVRGVHLEMTTGCNARCPMCSRNVDGGREFPGLPAAELTLDDVRKIFPDEFVSRLAWLYMCGNYGDALVARDTLKVFERFRAVNPRMSLQLVTNGSGRSPDWWRSLAATVSKCIFSIDGLEDTNHLYRRGTSWPMVMAAAREFIGAGGRAEWDFLVFRHNEHQVEEARALSRTMGFDRFNVKKSARFFLDGRVGASRPVRGLDGGVEYRLELPEDPAYRGGSYGAFGGTAAAADDASSLDSTPVHCKVDRDRELYVSAEGHAFPCCWTGKIYNNPRGDSRALIEKLPGGLASLDARRHGLKWIIEGPFFQSLVPRSWETGAAARRNNVVCAQKCGTGEPFRPQNPAP